MQKYISFLNDIFLKNKFRSLAALGFLLIIASIITLKSVNSKPIPKSEVMSSALSKPDSSQMLSDQINQDFTFLTDPNNKKSSSFVYKIISAEVNNKTVISGQDVHASEGKSFLIIQLKLVNNTDQNMAITTRNYIRLAVNSSNNEFMAPDFYNDPVNVQPISTKPTQLGFVIDAGQKDFLLKVGEIDGKKTDVKVDFN